MKFDRWDVGGFSRDAAVSLCNNGVNPLVSVLLASRGLTDIADVQTLIGVDTVPFHDPFLLADMEKAVACIKMAIGRRERIAIYGDYDVDGMTASAILALWLSSRGADYEIYIPGRFEEGYGLNIKALDALKSRNVGLVVTVDCGITALVEAQYAKEAGLGLVITDHHECRDVLPVADAVVNPKRSDCAYPYKSLAGVGVAYKLVCALDGDYLSDEMFRRYGELVAIGTVADVMPMMGENRDFIRRGLEVLNTVPRPGLKALLLAVSSDPCKITASTIGFTIAPRLNAAGRMGKPELSVKLLLTENEEEAKHLAEQLCTFNTDRRSLEQKIYEDAIAMLPVTGPVEPIVLAHSGWYQGVTGIVAAKLAERYRLPAIVISIDADGTGRGSCRSFGSFSIYEALCSCEDILNNYGGHEMAAGVTVAEENIEKLRHSISDYYYAHIEDAPVPGLRIDFEVEKPELLTIKNVEALNILEPFGTENPSPYLCITGAVLSSVQSIGAGKHTRLVIEKTGQKLDCIFFSVPADELGVALGELIDIAFEPQVNEYRGRSNIQLQLIDIRASQL